MVTTIEIIAVKLHVFISHHSKTWINVDIYHIFEFFSPHNIYKTTLQLSETVGGRLSNDGSKLSSRLDDHGGQKYVTIRHLMLAGLAFSISHTFFPT
jgi:hypothetical protein